MGRHAHITATYSVNPATESGTQVLDTLGIDPAEHLRSAITHYAIDVAVTVAYWKNAHALHNWIVTHAQNGNDHGRTIPLNGFLGALRRDIEAAIGDPSNAPTLIPSPTGYGDNYQHELNTALRTLDTLAALNPHTITYTPSTT